MRALRIICDLDSIVINLLGFWINRYNELWDDDLTVSKLSSYHIHNHVKPECGNKIYELFNDDMSFYRRLPALDGAIGGLEELHDQGHDIIIATATAGNTAQEKFFWCKKNLPFIPQKNIMVGARKEIMKAHVFIDDAPKNLEAYRAEWPEAATMTIAYPYNEHMKDKVSLHAQGHMTPAQAWYEIVRAIRELDPRSR